MFAVDALSSASFHSSFIPQSAVRHLTKELYVENWTNASKASSCPSVSGLFVTAPVRAAVLRHGSKMGISTARTSPNNSKVSFTFTADGVVDCGASGATFDSANHLHGRFCSTTVSGRSPGFSPLRFCASRKNAVQSWRWGKVNLASPQATRRTSEYPLSLIVCPSSACCVRKKLSWKECNECRNQPSYPYFGTERRHDFYIECLIWAFGQWPGSLPAVFCTHCPCILFYFFPKISVFHPDSKSGLFLFLCPSKIWPSCLDLFPSEFSSFFPFGFSQFFSRFPFSFVVFPQKIFSKGGLLEDLLV